MIDFAPLRTAIVGCGGMGLRHVRTIGQMWASGRRSLALQAVCDQDDRRAVEAAVLAEQLGLPRPKVVNTLDLLLADSDLEALCIILPTWLHHEVGAAALRAGKHIMVEKPLAISVAGCEGLEQAARSAGRIVSVAENYRRIPSNRAFKALLDSGALGAPRAMMLHRMATSQETYTVGDKIIDGPDWYHDPKKGGSYHVHELGVHEIDLQQYWFGAVDSVSASISSSLPAIGATMPGRAERTTLATLNFRSGMASQIAFIDTSPDIEIYRRLFVGEKGMAQSRAWHAWQDGEVVIGNRSEPLDGMTRRFLSELDPAISAAQFAPGSFSPDGALSNPAEPLSYGVGAAHHDFARAVRTGSRPEIGLKEGVQTLRICEAILRAAAEGKTIYL